MSSIARPQLAAAPKAQSRPQLRVVSSPRRRPRPLYAILATAMAVLIGGTQITLSALTTVSTYELSSLRTTQHELGLQAQVLTDELAGMHSPQYLASNATELGMVIGAPPSYLRLSDGAIIGSGQGATVSTVHADGSVTVPNYLLNPPAAAVTEPEPPEVVVTPEPVAPEPDIAPVLEGGLPSPQTH